MDELDKRIARVSRPLKRQQAYLNHALKLDELAMAAVRRYYRSLRAAGRDDQQVEAVRSITRTVIRPALAGSLVIDDYEQPGATTLQPAGQAWYIVPDGPHHGAYRGWHYISAPAAPGRAHITMHLPAALLYLPDDDAAVIATAHTDPQRDEPKVFPPGLQWVVESAHLRGSRPVLATPAQKNSKALFRQGLTPDELQSMRDQPVSQLANICRQRESELTELVTCLDVRLRNLGVTWVA